MKFITEMELRDLYKTEPFTSYVLEPDTKITPGARQFLVDMRVTLVQPLCRDSKKLKTNQPSPAPGRDHWCSLRLRTRMDRIDSLFLLIAAELLRSGDAALSEEILALGKCFRNVREAERAQTAPDNIEFWGWSAAEIKNQFDNLGENIDINEFHVGLENGKEIALLNHLRASLREVEPAVLETYWNEEKQVSTRQDLVDTVNLIDTILCMVMQKCLGGQTWKK